jgi:hypothetical protein
MAVEEHGATRLRNDASFLDRILSFFTSIGPEIKTEKDKRTQFGSVLKILISVISKGKSEDPSADILKSP